MRRIAASIPAHVRFRPRISGFQPSNASLGSPEDHRPRGRMDSSADFPRAEKRRRHCWRERVGNAGASFVRKRPPPPEHFQGAAVLTGYCTLVKRLPGEGTDSQGDAGEREKREKGSEGRRALVG